MKRWCALLLVFVALPTIASTVSVVDDAGRTVVLPAPAHRIVSLAPNITDALFAAGAGAYVVGTTRYSDHPAEARHVTVIGDATTLDLERIVGLKPDVVVVWRSGTPAAQVDQLKRLGLPLFFSETTRLADVADATRRFGTLAGTRAVADEHAAAFDAALTKLRETYAGKPHLSVFFQIWDRPLMTVGREQIIDDAIGLCGGVNIFANVNQAAPTVTREAVLSRNPAVIVSSGEEANGLDAWRKTATLSAAKHDNVIVIDAPTIALPSPSILPSVATLCRAIDRARERLSSRHP